MTAAPALRVRRLARDAQLPRRQHGGDAGLDLVAAEAATVAAGGGRATIGTGLAVELPDGWAGLVCPRSGLAARHGVTVLNGPGVIDAGYRGELRVVLLNTDPASDFEVRAGDRIAQLLLVPVHLADVEEVEQLAAAGRADRGFGSTGGFA